MPDLIISPTLDLITYERSSCHTLRVMFENRTQTEHGGVIYVDGSQRTSIRNNGSLSYSIGPPKFDFEVPTQKWLFEIEWLDRKATLLLQATIVETIMWRGYDFMWSVTGEGSSVRFGGKLAPEYGAAQLNLAKHNALASTYLDDTKQTTALPQVSVWDRLVDPSGLCLTLLSPPTGKTKPLTLRSGWRSETPLC